MRKNIKIYKSKIMRLIIQFMSVLTIMWQFVFLTGCSVNEPKDLTEGKDCITENFELKEEKCEEENSDKESNVNSEYKNDDKSAVKTDEEIDDETGDEEESSYDLSEAIQISAQNDSIYTITSEGIYALSGKAENYTLKVETDDTGKVKIVLKDVDISNDDFPVIYVKKADKCIVTMDGSNRLSVKGEFVSDEDIKTDAVIFSKDDLKINGSGSIYIDSQCGNGIASKDDLKITGGTYNISCGRDGLEANDSIIINEGDLSITAFEGIEATYVQINGGTININASDDGINAAQKSDKCDVLIEVNDGNIKIVMEDGDTDGIDSNGSIIINGGYIDITGKSPFDYDISATHNGGTIIINGEETDEIPSSMMGPGGFDPNGGMGPGGSENEFGKPGGNMNPGNWMGPGDRMNPDNRRGPDNRMNQDNRKNTENQMDIGNQTELNNHMNPMNN